MDHQHDTPHDAFAQVFGGCGYVDRRFDPNLIAALDKLGEQFGPLGVALAAATRTEAQQFAGTLREVYSHQRELWSWLDCDRYQASDDGPCVWVVVDTQVPPGDPGRTVGVLSGAADEDAAHALAEHLNRKIILAKVAQAVVDSADAQDNG